MKENSNIKNQAQECEFMENYIGFVEQNNDYMWLQQCFQDPDAANQVFSLLNDERKDTKPLYDDYISQSKNDEEGYDVLDTLKVK